MRKRFEYPGLDKIIRLYPGPQILLGKIIYWTAKYDGSNMSVWVDDEGEVRISSRHQDTASQDLQTAMHRTYEWSPVQVLVLENPTWFVFGELLQKGRSPTRINIYDEAQYIIFDIYDPNFIAKDIGRFMNPTQVHQICHHYGIPSQEILAWSQHTTLESLYEYKDGILKRCKRRRKMKLEGTVLKAYDSMRGIYAKEKLDTPKFEKIPHKLDKGSVQLPPLPDSEVLGAVDKAFVDLGLERFKLKGVAMPLIAKYVAEERKKHLCSKPRLNLYQVYLEVLTEREKEE